MDSQSKPYIQQVAEHQYDQNTTHEASTTILISFTAGLLSFLLIYYHIKKFTYWSSRGIKGPTPWPLIGTSVYYIFRNRVDVDQEWYEKYGRVYGIYEGYSPTLRITDHELIRFVWIKEFSSFTSRNSKGIYGTKMKRWLFWSEGQHWSNQRALITPIFTSNKLKSFYNTMSSCIERFNQEINSRMAESDKIRQKKAAVISKDQLMSMALDVMSLSLYGLKLNTYQDKNSEFYKRAFAFSRFDLLPFFVWLATPRFIAEPLEVDMIRYGKYEYFDKLSLSIIKERRNKLKLTSDESTSGRTDIIQALLDAKLPDVEQMQGTSNEGKQTTKIFTEEDDLEAHHNDQIKRSEMERDLESQTKQATFRHFSDDEISGQMVFFFLAGHETTATSLSFCFYELAHQQAAQQEVYEELKATNCSFDDRADYSLLQRLVKLDSFLSESMRLYCPVTEHNRLCTAKEGVVLPTNPPIRIPYGMAVSIPGFQLQRDPDYWPEPLKFDMNRFYPENRGTIKSCSYMPFGVGPRNCVGLRFALLEMKLCIAKTLLKYHVSPGPLSQEYPPKFLKHAFFLQAEATDFKLTPRNLLEK